MTTGTVLYCHGFASSGIGPKSLALIEEFGADSVIAPDLPIDPIAVEELLDGIVATAVKKGGPVVIVGTSLGGFWANYIGSKWLIPCIMVNPALHPSTTLKPRVGAMTYNYATGDIVVVTEDNLNEYSRREGSTTLTSSKELKTVFLASDDDVLDYNVALNELTADSVVVTPDGGHRFEKYWPAVISVVKNLIS